jgi:HAD superfamily hydrolase (TIGR01549 family)
MIHWIFLDVGNILLDEDPLTYFVFRRHVEAVQRVRPDLSFATLLAEREASAAAGSAWPVHDMVSSYLDAAARSKVWEATDREVRARFAELSPVVSGAAELVDRLAQRFRLGLIANQGRECLDRLTNLGMLARFDVVAFSELEGRHKPDAGLFERALVRARADPSQCLMVGDRIDNDLAPAARLGMLTAWVRWPRRNAKGWDPDEPDGIAYLHSLARTAALTTQEHRSIESTLIVDEVSDLDNAIRAAGVGPA